MIEPANSGDDRRVPISPQLAFRVAILGGVALVLFGIVFFRLWYLQVLSSNQYVALSNQNRTRVVAVPAPRGSILARGGQVLAGTSSTAAVQIQLDQLPAARAARLRLYKRLGVVLQLKAHTISDLVDAGRAALPYANVTIATDVSAAERNYIAERLQLFPSVHEREIYVRDYPLADLGAQVLGTVGLFNKFDERQPRYRGVPAGTIVGQSGIEAAYDRYLRGKPGQQRIEVNSLGLAQKTLPEIQPIPGQELRLTLDMPLEQEAMKAIQQGIALANGNSNPATKGAFVAMQPDTGEVLAMGSFPSFDPNEFVKPLTTAQYKAIVGASNSQPGPEFNRAVDGEYPTGSTFKPITALAGLQAGLITPSTTMGGGTCVQISTECLRNAGGVNDGNLDLVNALKVSEDTYFYLLGASENSARSKGGVLQAMARKLGLGRPTGIDLPGEVAGTIPDAAWRARVGREESQCEAKKHVPSCGISDKRPWSIGDNVNLATGQGDLQATPLQMAVVYSALATAYQHGGEATVPTPHLGLEIDDSQGRLIQRIAPPPARHVQLNGNDVGVVMDGIHAAASAPGGTSADVWAGWNQSLLPVYGKTGTAVRTGQADQAWYCAYIPGPGGHRPIVIIVTVEQGGFGDQAAAPVARLMASQYYGVKLKLVRGTSSTL